MDLNAIPRDAYVFFSLACMIASVAYFYQVLKD